MFELLLFISYINLSNIPLDIHYQQELSRHSTMSEDFILYNYYYQDQLLYSEPERNFESLSDYTFNNNFRLLLAEEIKKSSKQASKDRSREGIIPDIDLDLNMPRGLTNILGEGGRIRVEGSQSIDLEFKKDRYTYASQTSSPSIPQLILEQRLIAKINGTIGTKLHVEIDHDSDLPEQDNKVKFWYGGGSSMDSDIEDDIIQELHLGDLSATGGEKMFGIATKGKLGSTSFDIKAGRLETHAEGGGGNLNIKTRTETLNEKDYRRNQYFFTGVPHPYSVTIKRFGLFISSTTGTVKQHYLMDFDSNMVKDYPIPFRELEPEEEYEFRELIIEGNKRLPYFYIKYPYDLRGHYLGVYVIYTDETGKEDTLGDVSGEIYTLYELKSDNPTFGTPSWDMQMRNVYKYSSVGETTTPPEVSVEIKKIIVGGNNKSTDSTGTLYSEILGLTKNIDGKVNTNQLILEHGDIVFPDSFPFLNPGLGKDTVPIIYTKKDLSDLINDEGRNYEIIITTTSSSHTGTFSFERMTGFIIQDSERITADGKLLTKGTDYKINYQTGEVTFLEDAAIPPDAEIKYEYLSQSFFSFDSQYKAKLNIRSTPIKDSRLDLDLDFLSRSDKGVFHPSVGKEPSNITTGRVDFSLNKEPAFLNQFFSQLPLVSEDSKSSININGAYQFSLPNPSVGGKSYLDDMESVNLSYDLELQERIWYSSSLPDSSVNIYDLGKLDWFNDRTYPKSRIFPEYSNTSYEENRTNVLVAYFQPNTSIVDPRDSWNGMMKTFGGQYQNFSQKNFLEIWVKGEEGEIIFDMGDAMNEDIPRIGRAHDGTDSIIAPNGIKDMEDKNFDNLLQDGEDTGLDGVSMDDDNWAYRSDTLYDDGTDDYYGEKGTFTDSLKRHNKEGNGRLDSEDIDRDFTLDQDDHFFRYRINLASSQYLAKEGLNGWKVYIIPLKDSLSYEKIGNPQLESILFTRIWFRGFDKNTRITIAKIGIVGNKWQDKGIYYVLNDSLNPSGGTFKIGQRNTREDNNYTAPVEQEKSTVNNTDLQEQSLALIIDSLDGGNYCLVENYLELPLQNSGQGYDLRLYETLNFYAKYIGNTIDSSQIFLRFVTDSSNYYQFTTTITETDDWDTLDVVLRKFTDLKINNDTVRGNYSLKGRPSLKNVAFIQLGVINPSTQTMVGEAWFDDIVLTGADNRRGSNLNLNISSNVGDLITGISYSVNQTSSNYKSSLADLRQLGDRENLSQTFSITADAGKFLNKFVNCPVSFNTSQKLAKPTYRINSDVPLPEDEADSLTDREFSRNITVSISKRSKSNNWLLKHTIDNLQLGGSYRENEKFNPFKNTDTTTSSSASASYRLRIPTVSLPVVGGSSSSIFPTNIEVKTNYDYSLNKHYNYEDSTYKKGTSPLKKDLTSTGRINYKPIRWIDIDYSISTKRDLRGREPFSENRSLGNLGQDASLTENINVVHRSDFLGVNNLTVTYTNNFSQNHSIEYAKSLADTLDVRGCNQKRTLRINDDLKINSLLGKIPALKNFSKNISSLKLSANYTKDGSFAYLNSKPGYKFRYGIKTVPEINLFEDFKNTDGGYFNKIYSASSGFSFSRISAKINARYTEKVPDELRLNSTSQANKEVSFTFPSVDIDIPNIQKYLPFLSKYVDRTNLSISVEKDSSYTKGLNKDFSSGSSSLTLTPGFDLNLKNGLTFNIAPSYSVRKVYPGNSSKTNQKRKSLSVRSSYKLNPTKTGLPLPLLGRIKWDRPITLNATFKYESKITYSTDLNDVVTKSEDTRSIDFNFGGNYSFSDMVSGGLAFNYRNRINRRVGNQTSTSYGGSFNVMLKF